MKKMIIASTCVVGFLWLGAGSASADPPGCNWGEVTSEAIADGFDQGGHASSQANPRSGLANVIEQGNLDATCEFIAGP